MEEQPLTYQQILAEQYSDSARNALVYAQNEYNDDDDVAGHDARRVGQELEDQTEYGKFAGNRNDQDLLPEPAKFEDRGKMSVRYNKDVKHRILSIDSRFRSYADPGINMNANSGASSYQATDLANAVSLASHFVFRPNRPIKNVMSLKLTSLELPNKFFNIYESRGNHTFWARVHSTSLDFETYTKVSVKLTPNLNPDLVGYYYNNTTILNAVRDALKVAFPADTFNVTKDSEGKVSITANSSTLYDYYFPDSSFNPAPAFGIFNQEPTYQEKVKLYPPQLYLTLPEALGFQNYFYGFDPTTNVGSGLKTITSEDQVDMSVDGYIYLSLNDYDVVTPQGLNNTFFTVFAKIPVVVDKGEIIYDTDVTNTTTKTYRFLQPTDIYQLNIKLTDRLGDQLQMATNVNFSMTIEIEEVVSHSLYEKLREL